jgi:hypothetical protein
MRGAVEQAEALLPIEEFVRKAAEEATVASRSCSKARVMVQLSISLVTAFRVPGRAIRATQSCPPVSPHHCGVEEAVQAELGVGAVVHHRHRGGDAVVHVLERGEASPAAAGSNSAFQSSPSPRSCWDMIWWVGM